MGSLSRGEALARTAQLIDADVFDGRAGPEAIVAGLGATTVRLVADRSTVSTVAGQTALCAAFALTAMMGIGIDLVIPEVPLLEAQPPIDGEELRSSLLRYGADLIPNARVGTDLGPSDLTIVFGMTGAVGDEAMRLTWGPWDARLARDGTLEPSLQAGRWPFGALAAAGIAAAEAFRAALPRAARMAELDLPEAGRYRLDIDRPARVDLAPARSWRAPRDLGSLDVISAGAITAAALYVLLRVPEVEADLRVVDDDAAEGSNLNRYMLLRRRDVGRAKVDVLASHATDRLTVRPLRSRFNETSAGLVGPLAERVLVGVDDIAARWDVQRACGGWLCIGATSHEFIRITTHLPGGPCAGCAHPRLDEAPLDTIPTISFVSYFAGLLQARALLTEAYPPAAPSGMDAWPMGMYASRAVHREGVAPRGECPVGCAASRRAVT